MTPERWQRVHGLFEAALERAPRERESFLAEACGSDLALRDQVALLLANDARADRFLRDPTISPPDGSRADADMLGRRIGPYRIDRRLAAGGMGAVWLAERVDAQFKQRVAVKLIKRGMDTDDLLRRFRHERQVLANLRHPHISRLLDGGADDDGRPYLVMEYVDGLTIDRYCDEHRLGIRARLALYRQVCAAVQFAHQNLVVHRDLKPGNILVGADGAPTLLDFGIAKMLDPSDGGLTRETTPGARLLTPEYASPEQIRGEPITTASDVYSLGVVLYELLTGRRPHVAAKASPHALERIVCEQEPVRPSAAVLRGTTETGPIKPGLSPQESAAMRGLEPRRLSRRLAGDLDTIVLTALRKEPQRRYASVEALSEDIRRHLAALPVRARKDTFGYRAGKFIRRHRAPLAFAAAMFLAIAGFAVSTVVQSRRILAERNKAVAAEALAGDEAGRARAASEMSEAVAGFLNEMLALVSPAVAQGRDVSVFRDMLDQATARVDDRFADQPEADVAIRTTIGQAYASIAAYEQARALLQAALERAREAFGPRDPRTIEARMHVAGQLQVEQKLKDAEVLFREVLAELNDVVGEDDPATTACMISLANCLIVGRRFEEAETLLHKALAINRRLLGEEHPATLRARHTLADLLRGMQRLPEAEQMLRELIDVRKRTRGPTHPETLVCINDFGELLRHSNRLEQAEAQLRESLEPTARVFGRDHPEHQRSLLNLGLTLKQRGKLRDAEPLYRQVLDTETRLRGGQDLGALRAMNNLATLLLEQGKLQEAEALYRRVLDGLTVVLGEKHPYALITLHNLGDAIFNQGRLDEAEDIHRRTVELDRQVYGPDHPTTLTATNSLALVLTKRGLHDEADALYHQIIAGQQRASGPASHAALNARHALALSLNVQGRYLEAAALVEQLWEDSRRALGDDHPHTLGTASTLITIMTNAGRLDEADQLSAETIAIARRALGADDVRLGHVANNRGDCLRRLNRFSEAEPLLLEAERILRSALGDDHAEVQHVCRNLADLYETWGRRGRPDHRDGNPE